MHSQQLQFVADVRSEFLDFFTKARVLEMGSLDINGSVRSLFTNCNYIGIDVYPGPGVDEVCQAQDYACEADERFDAVISCEMMEHNPYWQGSFLNMARLCRPGGLVVMTCAGLGRGEHGTARTTPEDSPLTVGLGWTYYRNLAARISKRSQIFEGYSHIIGSSVRMTTFLTSILLALWPVRLHRKGSIRHCCASGGKSSRTTYVAVSR